jgi:hypothetical protein
VKSASTLTTFSAKTEPTTAGPVGSLPTLAIAVGADKMSVNPAKMISAAVGGCALLAAVLLNVSSTDQTPHNVAGGSGDSATTTVYTQPRVPAMSLNPTAMNLGGTATATPPATTLATSMAAPTYKASPAPECVNNGQCP